MYLQQEYCNPWLSWGTIYASGAMMENNCFCINRYGILMCLCFFKGRERRVNISFFKWVSYAFYLTTACDLRRTSRCCCSQTISHESQPEVTSCCNRRTHCQVWTIPAEILISQRCIFYLYHDKKGEKTLAKASYFFNTRYLIYDVQKTVIRWYFL